ncbi:pyridoxamine 5'-phosphate oxidase family protein [Antrihabitans cavernicola]|uniref:Pyridoxamine 5'-phosphate oxidase N-terminal domain-containing protein n=1 Tax=Antrihabitans cavernicola TaxID=2495913 RepID=A0A5A7SEQ5_9NOCA|nr:pyridoxamine 5'-phosphate oxidase family protein [Spelaeibacter cavernicola]KAA0024578.1 hypothetical protein FOY51_01075 [Spelaeibacter cavernicola]
MPTTTFPDFLHDQLDSDQIAWLTTTKGEQPQASPVWFLYIDGTVWIRSQPKAGKVSNIAANQRVAFHLDTSHSGHVLSVDATAWVFDAIPHDVSIAYDAKYRTAITDELKTTVPGFAADYSTVIALTPVRVLAW